MKKLFISFIAISLALPSIAQRQLYLGNDNFAELRYANAANYYIDALEAKPTLEATEKLADCYRFLNNYGGAEKYYRKAIKYPGSSSRNYYHLGQVLKVNQKYDEAKLVFTKYATFKGVDSLQAVELLKSCDDAKDWIAEEHNYLVRTRADLNSRNSDFGLVMINDSTLAYTTNRKKCDVQLSADQKRPYYKVAYSEIDDSLKAKKIRYIDFESEVDYHIATPSFTASGDTMFFTRSFIEKDTREVLNRLELSYSVKMGNVWSTPKKLPINFKNSSNGHPAWDAYNNKLIFISNRKGGFGGYDLYESKLVDGKWQDAVNLGAVVNSSDDEFYPTMVENQLYFSSRGHIGLGGLDIFNTHQINDTTWSAPMNLKTPFNSSYDDFAYSRIKDTNRGWYS